MTRVLTIQSHVVHGIVGNRAAGFLLQRMKIEADIINTVQFSNHTGYGAWTGEVFAPAHITALLDGIAARGAFAACDAVLSGYMGTGETGAAILDAVGRARAANPRALYCCDPVMGDVGRGFFVRPEIPEFIRTQVVPAADIMTPNQFELEALTGQRIGDRASALAACAALRAQGPGTVLMTSFAGSEITEGTIGVLLDTTQGSWLITHPRLALDPPPNGSGDAIAALFLGHLLRLRDPVVAAQHATAGIFALFEATRIAGTRELQLIAAQDEVVSPANLFDVVKVR